MSPSIIKGLIVLAVVAAIAGAGWYVNGLRADKARLEGEVIQLQADTDQLKANAARDNRALKEAQRLTSEANARARDAKKGITDAYKDDPDARAWADVPIPDSLRNSIRRK